MYKRFLSLPKKPTQSFFLWGPRQAGKTTLLKKSYPDAYRIDLLKSDLVIRYLQNPSVFREEVMALPKSQLVIIDEIQKVPVLLNEVHYLIQEENRVFGMCGSSARKVRRGHANLLGGRAIRYELLGLSAVEIGKDFNIEHMLNSGPIPSHYTSKNPLRMIQSYIDDYLKEEILQEGLIRSLPIFSDFLRVAAIGDTQVVNFSNIARESGVSANTVRDHYSILEDTLMGAFLPAYRRRPKRRMINAPKFYFRDVGVVNHLSRRGIIQPGSELFGRAFENWIFNELSIHSYYTETFYDISYWRLTTGLEVDFILGNAAVALEVKAKEKITSNDLKGLQQFRLEYPDAKQRIVISLEKSARLLKDGILILPYAEFLQRLWSGEWSQNLTAR